MARFVVEWKSGWIYDACTSRTTLASQRVLEDFINGGESASLLDCVKLTVRALITLADAIPPARAGPASVAPNGTDGSSSFAKQNAFAPSQGSQVVHTLPKLLLQGILP